MEGQTIHERIKPILEQLPKPQRFDLCYTLVRGNKPGERIGIVRYNERGYYLTDMDNASQTVEQATEIVDYLNGRLSLSADVIESMQYASVFGWDAPIAHAAHRYFES
jgi:hypothetical protein